MLESAGVGFGKLTDKGGKLYRFRGVGNVAPRRQSVCCLPAQAEPSCSASSTMIPSGPRT